MALVSVLIKNTCPCLTASERPATGAAVRTALTYKPHDKPKSYDQHLSWQGHEGSLRGAARDNILRFFISMSYYCLLFIKDNQWFLSLLKSTTWKQFQSSIWEWPWWELRTERTEVDAVSWFNCNLLFRPRYSWHIKIESLTLHLWNVKSYFDLWGHLNLFGSCC